jgi:phosphoribosylaminoimidazole-succinocarboxamide synthase
MSTVDPPPVTTSALPLRRLGRGKVRDIYEVDRERILLVATDRVSAFDVVMREPVPHKGSVLTQLSAWWFRRLAPIVPHHLITADPDRIVQHVPALDHSYADIAGRTMLCRRTDVVPIECVVRGYLAGSAWKEYLAHGTLAGEPLPAGLVENARLEPPIFSPATKAATGHDENISVTTMAELVGPDLAIALEQYSRLLYDHARHVAEERGIIVADTKFEFGHTAAGDVLLVDEVLTPDSSRFWPLDGYAPGRPQPSFDKQPLRDYLEAERVRGHWNGDPPPPPLPAEVVQATSDRYREIFRRLTGADLLSSYPDPRGGTSS